MLATSGQKIEYDEIYRSNIVVLFRATRQVTCRDDTSASSLVTEVSAVTALFC